jgi:hypothetical protein
MKFPSLPKSKPVNTLRISFGPVDLYVPIVDIRERGHYMAKLPGTASINAKAKSAGSLSP